MNSTDASERRERLPLPHGYPRGDVYAALAGDPVHAALRTFDDEFLAANRDALRDYQAHGVADPLHHWSRRWEYPYVFEQLAAWAQGRRELRMLDAGSGLTFFPHYVARELPVAGIECSDRDPAMERDAQRLRPPASPRVHYSTQDLAGLSFADESFDCTYCISVLEHTAERERIADEFRRTLRPGGLLVVTIDVSLDGRAEIPREEAARLIETLARRFEPLAAYGGAIMAPPAGVVTTGNVAELAPDLRPPRTYATAGGVARRLLHPGSFPWGRALRRLLGRGSGSAASELSFFCTAWRKPAGPAAAASPGAGA